MGGVCATWAEAAREESVSAARGKAREKRMAGILLETISSGYYAGSRGPGNTANAVAVSGHRNLQTGESVGYGCGCVARRLSH